MTFPSKGVKAESGRKILGAPPFHRGTETFPVGAHCLSGVFSAKFAPRGGNPSFETLGSPLKAFGGA